MTTCHYSLHTTSENTIENKRIIDWLF